MIITDVCGQGHGGATTGMCPGIPKGRGGSLSGHGFLSRITFSMSKV